MSSNINPTFDDIRYASSFDNTCPLRALAAYQPDHRLKPLIVSMHSYGGDRLMMQNNIAKLAAKGFFAVAPDMRGRCDSDGRRDDGGLEIADIYDTVYAVLHQYPNEIDQHNINIVGWSGGGGSVYMATVKMPDMFRSAQAFYGITDYGFLARSSDNWMRQVVESVGAAPDHAFDRYLVRNAVFAVSNNRYSHFQIFWDEQEELCPPQMNEDYLAQAQKCGLANIIAHKSLVSDMGRWIHGAEIHGEIAEAMYEPQILCGEFPEIQLAKEGSLIIPGFLVTRFFELCLGTGESTVAEVEYRLSDDRYEFSLRGLGANSSENGWLRIPCESVKTLPLRVTKDGKELPGMIHRSELRSYYYLYNIEIGSTYVLYWGTEIS